jgi:hypothetical protein
MADIQRGELFERLKRLDEDAYLLFNSVPRFRVVIVGGSALILGEYADRATHDIDAIETPHELHKLLDKYDINTQVNAYLNLFPYNYEDRLIPVLQGRQIDYFTASLEDIVISKLFASRDKDLSDIETDMVIGGLDWDLLNRIVMDDAEIKNNTSEREFGWFKTAYENYVKRNHTCES